MWRLGGKDGGTGDGWAATLKIDGFHQRAMINAQLTAMQRANWMAVLQQGVAPGLNVPSLHAQYLDALCQYPGQFSPGYSPRDMAALQMIRGMFARSTA